MNTYETEVAAPPPALLPKQQTVLRLYRALKAALRSSPTSTTRIRAYDPGISSLTHLSEDEKTILSLADSHQDFAIVPVNHSYARLTTRSPYGTFSTSPTETGGIFRKRRASMASNYDLDQQFRVLKQALNDIENARDIDITRLRAINSQLSQLLDSAQSTKEQVTVLNEKISDGIKRFQALVNTP